jgi:hypothetical protein
MKKTALVLISALALTPMHAFAEQKCYSDAEAEADQGIRIHSELMVIGLNCQVIGKRFGDDLYGTYRKFTADHANLFGGYEETLINHFKKEGAANPVSNLNELRTRYANKISDEAADMRPDIFCSNYAKRVKQAATMKEPEIKKWAGTIYPSHPVSRPLCSAEKPKAAK